MEPWTNTLLFWPGVTPFSRSHRKGNTIQRMFIGRCSPIAMETPSYHLGIYRVKSFPKEFTKMCRTSILLLGRLTQEQQEPLVFHTLHASFLSEPSYFCEFQNRHSEILIKRITASKHVKLAAFEPRVWHASTTASTAENAFAKVRSLPWASPTC